MYKRMNRKKILNVGCGSDTYGTHFIDLYPTRKEVLKCNVDTDKFPFPDNYFDEVYAKYLFEHLRNPMHFLSECYRVLKRGGKIIIITDNANYWVWAVNRTHLGEYEERSQKNEDRHYALFTPHHLRNHLEIAGFKEIRTGYLPLKSEDFKSANLKHLKYLVCLLTYLILKHTPFWRMAYPRVYAEAKK